MYSEIVNAVQNRRVEDVVSFGYSHGGGSTHDLCERLDLNRASIGTFRIPFTSYVDGVENASDVDVDQERAREVVQAVGDLSDRYRTVLMMRYSDGLSCRDIGQELGISANSVSIILHRAKLKLKEFLRTEEDAS